MNTKKVMVFGTFDGLHDGHRDFLRQAKEEGEHLIIVIARDVVIAEVHGTVPQHNEIDRLAEVLSEGVAQDIVMGHVHDKIRVLQEHRPDVIMLGFTQRKFVDSLHKHISDKKLDMLDIVIARPYKPETYQPSGFDDISVHL